MVDSSTKCPPFPHHPLKCPIVRTFKRNGILIFHHLLYIPWTYVHSCLSTFGEFIMTHWAKVRYTDSKGRSHYVTVESDLADRTFIEELVRAQYPAEKIYFQGVYNYDPR